jgi:hypothetical protein
MGEENLKLVFSNLFIPTAHPFWDDVLNSCWLALTLAHLAQSDIEPHIHLKFPKINKFFVALSNATQTPNCPYRAQLSFRTM